METGWKHEAVDLRHTDSGGSCGGLDFSKGGAVAVWHGIFLVAGIVCCLIYGDKHGWDFSWETMFAVLFFYLAGLTG